MRKMSRSRTARGLPPILTRVVACLLLASLTSTWGCFTVATLSAGPAGVLLLPGAVYDDVVTGMVAHEVSREPAMSDYHKKHRKLMKKRERRLKREQAERARRLKKLEKQRQKK